MLKHSLQCALFPLFLSLLFACILRALHRLRLRPYQQLFLFTAAAFPALIESNVLVGGGGGG